MERTTDGKATQVGEVESRAIRVSVRIGSSRHEAIVAFSRPKEIAQLELLRAGFALLGDEAVATVTPATYAHSGGLDTDPERAAEEGRTLFQALRDVEVWMMKWLADFGYEVGSID